MAKQQETPHASAQAVAAATAKATPPPGHVDPEELVEIMGEIAGKSHRLVQEFLERQRRTNGAAAVGAATAAAKPDPLNVGQAFLELTARMMANPAQIAQAQFTLWQDYMRLWQSTAQRMLGQGAEPVVRPQRGDRRFKDPAWDDNALFDFIKQSYLLTARWMMNTVGEVEGLDEKSKQKIDFYTRQYVDAMAPSNFVLTNPEVLRATVESRGENLLRGLRNMLDDLERGKGRLAVKMTDTEAFEVGRNIALSPGKVVFQNDLMQLIQYEPTTEQVHKRPLLIIPPWINKYYILDLQPKNSFIKYAVDQGFTVFVISWVNPDERHANKTFEDYMVEGTLTALDAMERATGEKEFNVVGYCLGGTLLACNLAYMAEKGDRRIKAATFFTTLVDFSEPGDLGVFIDEEQISSMEQQMARQGYLDGRQMATTFNMLRSNDLIWSFVINNYLLGKDPFPFDLLYWNSDNTRMPYAMHSFYLRKMYQENRLLEPGGITLGGVPIDLGKIHTPSYFLSTREDHIAPWLAAYAATQIFKGPKRFVLAGSGHIAGVVNPPTANKYGYWIGEGRLPKDPEAWLESAAYSEGSWWPDWVAWLAPQSGPKVPARKPGEGELKPIEDAPGSYVKVRAVA